MRRHIKGCIHERQTKLVLHSLGQLAYAAQIPSIFVAATVTMTVTVTICVTPGPSVLAVTHVTLLHHAMLTTAPQICPSGKPFLEWSIALTLKQAAGCIWRRSLVHGLGAGLEA